MRGTADHGDEFAEWCGALWPRVLRAVTVSVGDRDLAEEATAEAFAKTLARWSRPAKLYSPASWLHKVAVNEVRSYWRRARLERRVLERVAAEPGPPAFTPEPRDDGRPMTSGSSRRGADPVPDR